jgi:Tfp pilus assembly protein PilX
MAPVKKTIRQKREGTILIIAMIFVVIFSTLVVSMATISVTNRQIATNQQFDEVYWVNTLLTL